MAKATSEIQRKQLYLNGDMAPFCVLGSPTWFAWLETNRSLRVCQLTARYLL